MSRFMDLSRKALSDLIVYSKYSTYLDRLSRRETWEEAVARVEGMHLHRFPHLRTELRSAFEFVYDKKVLPSMRTMQFAGKAIEANEARSFNCSYLPMNAVEAFREVMFLLLSGAGVGFSVQDHHISQLPDIQTPSKPQPFIVPDTIEGWGDAVHALLSAYFYGDALPVFDYSHIRPKGARLITSGGSAPGHEPLKRCLEWMHEKLAASKRGQKLSSLQVHDLVCSIADAVLAGGIRRASLISLFDRHDQEMLWCKSDPVWFSENPQRMRSNNSAVFLRYEAYEKEFEYFFNVVSNSKFGEPGIFWTNHPDWATNPCVPDRTWIETSEGKKQVKDLIGVPFEALVNGKAYATESAGFFYTGKKLTYRVTLTNGLSVDTTMNHPFLLFKEGEPAEWVALEKLGVGDFVCVSNHGDGDYSMAYPIESITELQEEDVYDVTVSNVHEFCANGIRLHNCSEASLPPFTFCNLTSINVDDVDDQEELERRAWAAALIGTMQASYTHFHYLRPEWKVATEQEALLGVSLTGIASGKCLGLNFTSAAQKVVQTNATYAARIGINQAARTTLVKPEGTGSLSVGASSGIHDWHSNYYLRRFELKKIEPLYAYFRDTHPQLLEDKIGDEAACALVGIPVKAPENAIIRGGPVKDMLDRIDRFYSDWVRPGHNRGVNTHTISCTLSVKDHEWSGLGEWMWDNRESYSCLALLPYDGGDYPQLPFEEISEEEYERKMRFVGGIKLADIVEKPGNVQHAQELSCASGVCEVTSL